MKTLKLVRNKLVVGDKPRRQIRRFVRVIKRNPVKTFPISRPLVMHSSVQISRKMSDEKHQTCRLKMEYVYIIFSVINTHRRTLHKCY